MWGALSLSDERTGLSFTTAAGPCQRSHSRIHFTVSDPRLPFSSPPTTGKATVEAFDPASKRDSTELLTLNSFHNHFVRTEYKALFQTITLMLLAYSLPRERLPSRCLVMDVSSGSTILAFNVISQYVYVSGSGGTAPLFLMSTLYGSEWSTSRPGRFTPGERAPGTH
jgi:hypothetical protein